MSSSDHERIDARLDRRAADVSSLIERFGGESSWDEALDVFAEADEIQSIAIVDMDSGQVVGSSQPAVGESVDPFDDADFRSALDDLNDDGATTGVYSAGNAVRVVSVVGGDQFVAIAFDREAAGADLADARGQTMLALGSIVVLLVAGAYVATGRFIERPYERAIVQLSQADGIPSVSASRDPISTLQDLTAALANAPRGDAQPVLAVASRLPAMWIALDPDLNVIDSRIEVDENSSHQDVSLDIETLSDLLSDSVVSHVERQVAILAPGESATFEFSVGHRDYSAEIACHDVDAFELAILEQGAEVGARGAHQTAVGEDVLDALLAELPFTLLELDDRGTIVWSNAPYLGHEPGSIVGRSLVDLLPGDGAKAGGEAIRSVILTGGTAAFLANANDSGARRWSHSVASYEAGHEARVLVAAIESPAAETTGVDPEAARQLEEQLWTAELRVSEVETELESLREQLGDALAGEEHRRDLHAAVHMKLLEPLRNVVRASLGSTMDASPRGPERIELLRQAIEQLAATFDDEFGTSLAETMESGVEPVESRFHVATFLDEIAIQMSRDATVREARISVRVQPSLPRWLHGHVSTTRATIYQMIEVARLVAYDRPLVLAARQDTSTGRSVQVRFEIEIPPPKLDEGALEVVRGCLSGDTDAISEDIAGLLGSTGGIDFSLLHVELLTIEGQSTVLRCSSAFEVAEEPESDHSWVRGLRTLIVQDKASPDNGIQTALGAFGIIGYVVSDQKDLVEALQVAEAYANPYRFVLADVDTPKLESFIGQLFDGDAPVVLVGTDSESAMVGAISAGYDGYLAKPVRQLDLLEVILSTVEPPAGSVLESAEADAA